MENRSLALRVPSLEFPREHARWALLLLLMANPPQFLFMEQSTFEDWRASASGSLSGSNECDYTEVESSTRQVHVRYLSRSGLWPDDGGVTLRFCSRASLF